MDVRVYYEDTDAAGVVYHSNYLKYFERARTELFRMRGLSVSELAADGFIFPVVRMEVDFKVPARHDDLLRIDTVTECRSGSSFTLRQRAVRVSDGRLLVSARVKLACVDHRLKARRIPLHVAEVIESTTCDMLTACHQDENREYA